ncbi:MAG: 4Fe-4S dicluster domain-containing protein [Desulfosarcinaceae bacterium]|jgi:heterodisulfide reductase subunit C
MLKLTGDSTERNFLEQVIARSGQNLRECLQCGKCSGSCPIASQTVGGPRRLIAKILTGMREQALADATWWYCVSCGSCASRCPVEINMYAVATTLCEMAADEGVKAAEPGIHLFEDLFLTSVRKYGRVQELKTVMQFNLKSFKPFKDAAVGARMMLRGVITPQALLRVPAKDPKVADIFDRVRQREDKPSHES